MIDCNFPIIQFDPKQSPRQWGHTHGESWRTAIAELVETRAGLMREKNPALTPDRIKKLAMEQWAITKDYDAALADELSGISEGSGSSITDLIVLKQLHRLSRHSAG